MDQALAASTTRLYQNSNTMFKNFVVTIGKTLRKALKDGSVELWLAQLSERGLSYGSVRSHLSALRHCCARRGLPAQLDSPRIQLILKGIKRDYTKKAPRKAVATTAHLKRLISTSKVIFNRKEHCRFAAMIALAFFGFLRPSEYCITPANHYLRWNDVKFSKQKNSVRLTLKSYKHSCKESIVQLSVTGSYCCPVKWLLSYMASYEYNHSIPLFDVTAKEFRVVLHELREAAGIKTKLTPHSFRHGGASWASNHGWPDARVRAHGRWHLDAYKQYVRAY